MAWWRRIIVITIALAAAASLFTFISLGSHRYTNHVSFRPSTSPAPERVWLML